VNDQERQIIADIFKRLEQTAGQQRDADAERFINDKLRSQPYAPYAMAQALYVQEEALKSLNQQLEQAKAENEHLQQQAQSSQSGGFLSSIFGGGQQRPQPPQFSRPDEQRGYGQPGYPQGGPQQGGPWGGGQPGGYAPQAQGGAQGAPWGGQPQQQAAPAGGGFLRGALTTAAGVAGGMVVGNALMNAFSGSGGGHSTLGNLSQSDMASMGIPSSGSGGLQDASFGDGGNAFGGGSGGSGEPQYQDASFADGGNSWGGGGGGDIQDASYDDGGDAFGDGGDDDGWT
jgi:hypothetical protein